MSVNKKTVATLESRDIPPTSGSAEVVTLLRCESGAASFSVRHEGAGAVLTVNGEIDAANAERLADYGQHCAGTCDWLVVNLTGLTFLGVAGFSALHMINTQCTCANVKWRLVLSSAVSRLPRVCDPDSRLPLARSVPLARAAVQHDRQLLPQLFAESR
ncbi:MAG: STAS domain-containing protein [Mycobacterium sp.]